MTWKDDYIKRYGQEAYDKRLAQRRGWGRNLPGGEKQRSQERRDADPEKWREYDREWSKRNPEKVKEKGRKVSRKGGKYYEKKQKAKRIGIQGEREKIRMKHGNQWRAYKNRIASDSELHHEWIDGTAKYRGLALVDANAHRRGTIVVIEVLEGEITLFTENHIYKTKNAKIGEE